MGVANARIPMAVVLQRLGLRLRRVFGEASGFLRDIGLRARATLVPGLRLLERVRVRRRKGSYDRQFRTRYVIFTSAPIFTSALMAPLMI